MKYHKIAIKKTIIIGDQAAESGICPIFTRIVSGPLTVIAAAIIGIPPSRQTQPNAVWPWFG